MRKNRHNEKAGTAFGSRTGAGGFTLVEMLTVVTIVTILAALLLGGLATALKRARRAQCSNNVRQLGVAAQLFVSDSHVYPLHTNPGGSKGSYPEHRTSWIGALQGALDKGPRMQNPGDRKWYEQGIWACPSASRPSSFPDGRGYNAYGYNGFGLSPTGVAPGRRAFGLGGHFGWGAGPDQSMAPPVGEAEVANPAQLILLGDGLEGGGGVVVDGLLVVHRNPAAADFMGSTGRSNSRHSGKANIAFCDGHVEAVSLSRLFEDNSDAALAAWNRDGLAHRELLSR